MHNRYEKYKESGVEWIGEIPEGWQVIKLKYIAKICNGQDHKGVFNEEGEYPIYGSGGIFGKADRYLYNKPSVLLGRKGTVDKPIYVNQPFWTVDTAFYTKISKKIEPIIFFYLCQQIDFKKFIYGSALPSMTQKDLNDIFLLLIPLLEQQAIARFLEHKTAMIDRIISNRKRQIELLKEERKAVINQAVTKGINPDVIYKDSGIEWLGDIPEHWDVVKLKYLSKIKTGEKDTVDNEGDGIYPFFVRSQTIERISTYSFDGEAVLTAGDGVGVGKVFHYINGKFDYHQRVYKVSHFKRIVSKYFFYYFQEHASKEFHRWNAKSTVDSLRLPMLLEFPVVFGEILEQVAIVQHIEERKGKIDTLISKYEKQIELMQEYRTVLISNAVTGQIDVRGRQEPGGAVYEINKDSEYKRVAEKIEGYRV